MPDTVISAATTPAKTTGAKEPAETKPKQELRGVAKYRQDHAAGTTKKIVHGPLGGGNNANIAPIKNR